MYQDRNNKQYKCKDCAKYQRKKDKYTAYNIANYAIKKLVEEGVGMSITLVTLDIPV